MNIDLATIIITIFGSSTIATIATALINRRSLNAEIEDRAAERWRRLANEHQAETITLRDRLGYVEDTLSQARNLYDAEIRWLKDQNKASAEEFNKRIEKLENQVERQAAIIANLHAQMRDEGITPAPQGEEGKDE